MYTYVHGSLVTEELHVSHHNEKYNCYCSLHESNKTCSVHFCKEWKGKKTRRKTICKIRNVSVNKIYLSLLSACKQVGIILHIGWQHVLTPWCLVADCPAHAYKRLPTPVHFIASCYMASQKMRATNEVFLLRNTARCSWIRRGCSPHLLLVNLTLFQ